MLSVVVFIAAAYLSAAAFVAVKIYPVQVAAFHRIETSYNAEPRNFHPSCW